jgi:integrase
MTFEEILGHYLKSPNYKRLAESSQRQYLFCADRLSEYLGNEDVTKMRCSTFIKLQSDLSDRPALVNMITRVASVIFSHAVDLDLIQYNPVARLKKLKIGGHMKWTPEEVRSIIALHDRKISTAVMLAWYTGQREGDVLSMRWGDCSDGYITMTQSKTGVEMKIKIHPDLADYLSRIRGYEDDSCYLVSGREKMTSSAFRAMFRRKCDKAGVNKTFHGIRKGVASSLTENGRSLKEVAAILGHKTLRMVAYYAEQADGQKLTSSAVDSMTSCV